MKILIIASMFAVVGFYLYIVSVNRFFREKNGERRSGKDRRKGFYASKNKMRRSGKDRRALMNNAVSAAAA